MRGIAFWSAERDATLRAMWRAGQSAEEISNRFRNVVGEGAVKARAWQLGLGRGRLTFWTPERDKLLEELWPSRKSLGEMREALRDAQGRTVSVGYISARASQLGLQRRNGPASEGPRSASKPRAPSPASMSSTISAAQSRKASPRRPRERTGEHAKPEAEFTAARAARAVPDFSACPFIDPAAPRVRCGETVDRRMRPDGSRPSQYCEAHRSRVLPLEKGALGHISFAGRRG